MHKISYKLPISKIYTSTKKHVLSLILCSQVTLFNHIKIYKYTGSVPAVDDDGIADGRPMLLPNTDLVKLNVALNTVGYAETIDGLSISMIDIMEKVANVQGKLTYPNPPSQQILGFYQIKSIFTDKTISLFRSKFSMNKTSRHQMVSTSIINLMSHTGAVAYSNFYSCATNGHHILKLQMVHNNIYIYIYH